MIRVNDQSSYTEALTQVEVSLHKINNLAFSLRCNDDFMFFCEEERERHLMKITDARLDLERLVRLIVRVEAYAEDAIEEARETTASERLRILSGDRS